MESEAVWDFRSDTVTRPSDGMREAMMRAVVGDDVYGEDETVRRLEERLAGMFSQEAGLFCPSGTMSNQLAILAQSRPGQEVICSDLCHIYNYEGGGAAANAGVQLRVLTGARPGQFSVAQAREAMRGWGDVHLAPTAMIAVEDTSNRGGGSVWEGEVLTGLSELAREHGVVFHLDGARVFNRLVAMGEESERYGAKFSSISVCLSKGLGAPVGSVLLGSSEMIGLARRHRKRLGGGMRQAGMLAAAGLYALDHHVAGLKRDHELAEELAGVLRESGWCEEVSEPQTNIVMARVRGGNEAVLARLGGGGVRASRIDGEWVRWVTHRDVGSEGVARVKELLGR